MVKVAEATEEPRKKLYRLVNHLGIEVNSSEVRRARGSLGGLQFAKRIRDERVPIAGPHRVQWAYEPEWNDCTEDEAGN